MNPLHPYEIERAIMYHGYRRPHYHPASVVREYPTVRHEDRFDRTQYTALFEGDYKKTYVFVVTQTFVHVFVTDADIRIRMDRRKHKKLNYNKYANIYDLVQDALTYLEKVAYEDCIKKGQVVMRKVDWANLCSCGHTQLTSSI